MYAISWSDLFYWKNIYTATDVVNENDQGVVTLAAENGRLFDYQAGQFIYLRVLDGNYSFEEHPASLTSAPENPMPFPYRSRTRETIRTSSNASRQGRKWPSRSPWRFRTTAGKTSKTRIKASCCSPAVSVLHLCWASWKACAKKMPKIKRCSSGVCATRMNFTYSAELASFRKICPISPSFPFYSSGNGYLDAKKTEAICESAEFLCHKRICPLRVQSSCTPLNRR